MGGKFDKKVVSLNGTSYTAYKILGQGQYGIIYSAHSKGKKADGTKIPPELAIKEYFYSRFRDQDGNNFCEGYWQREVANTQLQSQSPHAQLKIIDAGKVVDANHQEYYIVLNFIEGKTLKDWYADTYGKKAQFDQQEIAQITNNVLIPIANHLDYCHKQGLVHRDLSIDNILIRQPRKKVFIPAIIDWGASKKIDLKVMFNPKKPYFQATQTSSTAFMNRGTPPEIIMGFDPVAASDIYMLGHIMYFIFSGGKTCRTPAVKEDYVLHPRSENPALPIEYDQLVEKCTQYEPADRVQSMESIVHILEKLTASISPAQITGFFKPQQYASLPSNNPPKKGNISPSPVPSFPKTPPVPTNPVKANPAAQGVKPGSPAAPVYKAYPSQPITSGPSDVPNPSPTPSKPSLPVPSRPVNNSVTPSPSPNYPNSQPPSQSTGQNMYPANQSPVMNTNYNAANNIIAVGIVQTPVLFQVDERTTQFALAFIRYFDNPSWDQQRQDSVQIYYTFFDGMVKAFKNHSPLIQTCFIDRNVYFVGRTLGSLNELRMILIYFTKVLQKVPSTKIIFLGHYFNNLNFDLEALTYLLSFKCLYPQNVFLLRGPTEERTYLERLEFYNLIQKRFTKYSQIIFEQICDIISNMELLIIADLGNNLRMLATAGGIPFSQQNPTAIIKLTECEDKLRAREWQRNNLDEVTQSIIWGKPNEFADSLGVDSQGNIFYSWSILQNFIKVNNLRYLICSDSGERGGHRTIWNLVSAVNSSSLEHNHVKKEAKILRVSVNGVADLLVRDLRFYLERDYGLT